MKALAAVWEFVAGESRLGPLGLAVAFLAAFLLLRAPYAGSFNFRCVLLARRSRSIWRSAEPLASFPIPAVPTEGAAPGSVEPKTFEVNADAILPARTGRVVRSSTAGRTGRLAVYAQGASYRGAVPQRSARTARERFYPGGEKFSELRFVDGVAGPK